MKQFFLCGSGMLFIALFLFLGSNNFAHAQETVAVTSLSQTNLQISCVPSLTSVQPDQAVFWTPTIVSGNDSSVWYTWILEGDNYLRERITHGVNLTPFEDKFQHPGTRKRYIEAYKETTTNKIGVIPCGSLEVRQFDLKSPDLKPDLVFDKIYFKPTQGSAATSPNGFIPIYGDICIDIKNIGMGGSTGTFSLLFSDSFSTKLVTVPEPGEISTACVLNLNLVGSTVHKEFVIDKDKRINESKIDNNTGSGDVVIPEPPKADIELTSSNSGIFSHGQTMDISWKSSNIQDKSVRLLFVTPDYQPGNYQEMGKWHFIADKLDNNGTYSWKIPPSYNGQYRIHIEATTYYGQYPIRALSSQTFQISPAQAPTLPNSRTEVPIQKTLPPDTTEKPEQAPVSNPVKQTNEVPDSTSIQPATQPLPPKANISNPVPKTPTIGSFGTSSSTLNIPPSISPISQKPKINLMEVIRNIFNKIIKYFD